MIGHPILDPEAAEPAVGQIDLHLGTKLPFRANGEDIANDQHPDQQFRVDRGAARVTVIRTKLVTHPTEIRQSIDSAH